jgi:hypothetical protein
MAEAARRVAGNSGARCPESGPYRSSGMAKVVIFVRQGDTFPPDADGSPTTWVLVTSDEPR